MVPRVPEYQTTQPYPYNPYDYTHHYSVFSPSDYLQYASDDPTLPSPWKAFIDGNTGFLYYWNPLTNLTQYERPDSSFIDPTAHDWCLSSYATFQEPHTPPQPARIDSQKLTPKLVHLNGSLKPVVSVMKRKFRSGVLRRRLSQLVAPRTSPATSEAFPTLSHTKAKIEEPVTETDEIFPLREEELEPEGKEPFLSLLQPLSSPFLEPTAAAKANWLLTDHRVSHARNLFYEIPLPNISRWFALISAYVHSGFSQHARGVFWPMQSEVSRPTKVVIPCVLKDYGHLWDRTTGEQLLAMAFRFSLELDAFALHALMDMCSTTRGVEKAHRVFLMIAENDLERISKDTHEYVRANRAALCTNAVIQGPLDLEKLLVEAGLFESKEEADKREAVFQRIGESANAWVMQFTRLRGYTDQMVEVTANSISNFVYSLILTMLGYCNRVSLLVDYCFLDTSHIGQECIQSSDTSSLSFGLQNIVITDQDLQDFFPGLFSFTLFSQLLELMVLDNVIKLSFDDLLGRTRTLVVLTPTTIHRHMFFLGMTQELVSLPLLVTSLNLVPLTWLSDHLAGHRKKTVSGASICPANQLLYGGLVTVNSVMQIEFFMALLPCLWQLDVYTEFMGSTINGCPNPTLYCNSTVALIIIAVVPLEGFFLVLHVRETIMLHKYMRDFLMASTTCMDFYLLLRCFQRGICTVHIRPVNYRLNGVSQLMSNICNKALDWWHLNVRSNRLFVAQLSFGRTSWDRLVHRIGFCVASLIREGDTTSPHKSSHKFDLDINFFWCSIATFHNFTSELCSLNEPYARATPNLPLADGLFLETNDLSNPVEPIAGFDMLDQYLIYFDADDTISQYIDLDSSGNVRALKVDDLLHKSQILYFMTGLIAMVPGILTFWLTENFIMPVGDVEERKSMSKEVVLGGDVWDFLDELVLYMGNPMKSYERDAKFVSAVLPSGPPGTGKTFFAGTLAKESGLPFVFASGIEFTDSEKSSAARINEMLSIARQHAPSLIIVDEFDAIVGSHARLDPRRRATFEALIAQLDGEKDKTGVVVRMHAPIYLTSCMRQGMDFVWYDPFSRSQVANHATQRARDFHVGWFIHSIVYGEYPRTIQAFVGNRLPTLTTEEDKMVKGSMDIVGLNQYTSSCPMTTDAFGVFKFYGMLIFGAKPTTNTVVVFPGLISTGLLTPIGATFSCATLDDGLMTQFTCGDMHILACHVIMGLDSYQQQVFVLFAWTALATVLLIQASLCSFDFHGRHHFGTSSSHLNCFPIFQA